MFDKKTGQGIESHFDQYVDAFPHHQNAVNAIPGWTGAFPSQFDIKAGSIPLFDDPRIKWCLEHFGPVAGCHVLELGPLEGAHTSILDAAGATVEAIEANKLAYMRCLVFKEVLNLTRSHFYLGNFEKWLERVTTCYDLILACGVLYHMKDPLRLLELISEHTRAVYLWTHYMSETNMPATDPRRRVFVGDAEVQLFRGVRVRLHRRTYASAPGRPDFCGGMYDEHRWMQREDLLAVLSALGFSRLSVGHDDVHHSNGPALSIFARKET
jgi:hypothetical protein